MTDKRTPLDFEYIQNQATGNYVSRIFPAIGIKLQDNHKKHQPCPLCGGTDRFRCDDKGGSGSWICNNCGAGNGYTLVREYTGKDAYETHALIAEVLGIDGGKTISEADKKAWREAQAKREQIAKNAKKQARLDAANRAANRYIAAQKVSTHTYLTKKQINVDPVTRDLRVDSHGNLLIPMYYHNTNTGNITLCNVQSIDTNSKKLFVRDAVKKGAFFSLAEISSRKDESVVFVATGFATAASIYMATDFKHPVFVTFDDGNMVNCAYKIRTFCPQSRLIFCADDDHKTALNTGKNSGLDAGRKCAELVQAEYISPDFGGDERIATGELTDFNDLHCVFGLDVLKAQISHALNKPTKVFQRQDVGSDKLDKLLKTYAFITEIGKKSNKIYNLVDKVEMTKTQFEQDLGDKELANRWYYHPDKQSISREQVRAYLSETTAEAFADIFEQFWYIQGTKEVYNHETGERWPIDTLRLDRPLEYDIWLKSDRRQKVKNNNIWFDPTRKRRPKDGENYINTFGGLPLTPFNDNELAKMMNITNPTKQEIESFLYGVVSPLIELISHLCGNDAKENPKLVNWILNWLAIPLQHPGTKMDTALVFHGHIQGAGKSLFFDRIMRRIYGDFALTLGQGQLVSQYNDWVEGKLFAVFEEIFEGKDRYAHMGMIKQLITGDTVYINKKFVSGWTQDNYVNTVFLSNDIQPLSIEENDRRHVVMYPTATIPDGLRSAIAAALEDSDNLLLRSFYTYLTVKDVGNQNAHTKAIQTIAKTRLQEISMASWERFYTYWKRGDLDVPYMTCLTSDLYNYYVYWCKKNGERATSSTKLLTFVGLREHKERIRYSYHLQNGSQLLNRTGQGMALIIDVEGKKPDQNLFGVLVSRFKSAMIGAQAINYDNNTNESNSRRIYGSHENSNPYN